MMKIKFYKTKESYGCFSNFARYNIQLDGLTWPTTEHYFQAQKYVHNSERYMAIHGAATPRIAADLGRDHTVTIRPDWEQIKDDVMRRAILKKFETHADIKKILLDTGDADVIEDSPVDYYWGVGANGTGKNMLGKILMEVRDILRQTPVL